jgi:hypothetical protein
MMQVQAVFAHEQDPQDKQLELHMNGQRSQTGGALEERLKHALKWVSILVVYSAARKPRPRQCWYFQV